MSVIKNFVAKLLFKKRGAIANNKAVEFSAKDIEQRLRKFNVDPNTIKSEGELKQVLAFVQQAEDQAFIDRFGNMLQGSRFGKSADVLDMTGKKLDPNKGIMGGTQTTEETIKENLMKTDNPFSELVRATEKGPKSLADRLPDIDKSLRDKKVPTTFSEDIKRQYGLELTGDETVQEVIDMISDINKNKKDFATGGRAGFDMGGAPSIVLNPDERKAGKVFETDKVEDAIKEIIKRSIGPLDMAEIPLTEKGRLRFGFDSSGDRQISGGLDLLGGELNFGAGEGKQGKGMGFEFRKKFDKGGMSRRKFMKIMGGLAALPIVGKFFKGAKPAAKVAEVATKSTGRQPPSYFFDLADKIKKLGKVTDGPQERVKIHSMPAKDGKSELILTEDIGTGEMQIKKIGKEGDELTTEVQTMEYTPGLSQADETTKRIPADQYDEYTEINSRIIKDEFNEPDIIEGINVEDIVKEVKDQAPPIKKASGGRASFSKGGIHTYLKNLLNFLAEKEGKKGSDQLRALNPKSFPRKIRTNMSAKQLKDVEANRAEYLEGLLDMLEADKRNMTKMKATADQVFKQSMKEAVAAGDTEKIKLLKKAGGDLIREEQEKGIPYLKILRQFEDTNIDDTISEGQKMLKDFQIKKGLRKLNASGGVAMMLGE